MSIAQEPATLISDFAEFLTTHPSGEEILAWRPSQAAQNRLSDLLFRKNAGTIDRQESQELSNSLQAEMMLRLLKAKLQLAQAKRQ